MDEFDAAAISMRESGGGPVKPWPVLESFGNCINFNVARLSRHFDQPHLISRCL
jgi:hypothetical protein